MSVSQYHGVRVRAEFTDEAPRAEDLSNYKVCCKGEIVVNRMSAYQGALGVSPVDGLASPDYMVLRLRANHDARYWEYLMRSHSFVSEMSARVRGVGTVDAKNVRTPRISFDELKLIEVPKLSYTQERAIADFLDRETAKIDALIEKQNNMISLLLERRSGALGALLDVDRVASPGPRLKHHIASVRQGWSPQCNDWPAEDGSWAVLRAGCINGGRFRPWDNKELPDGLEPRRDTVVRVGDLIVSRANTRELVGGAAVVREPHPRLMLSDKLYAFALRKSANPDFVALVLRTRRYRDLIELEATGASPSMQNITQEVLRNLPMSLPDRQTQDQLACETTARLQRTDALIAKAEEFVSFASERRAALITAAVTGQIDVMREASRHGAA